jgi:hypothetical protein
MALSKQDLEARAKAIADGKTRYIRPSDGQEWVIRNLKNPRLRRRYGGQGGTDETAVQRKGSRGGGTKGARKQAEALTTPDRETRRLADQEMARMRTRGNVGHHGLPVSSLAAGEREKPGTVKAYEKVHGKGQVGHTPGALVEMTPEAHDRLHHVEETKYYRSIRQAGRRSDNIFSKLGAIVFKSNIKTPPQQTKPVQQQTKPVQQQTKPEKPKRRPKSNLKSSMGTIGFGFNELTGGYTGADSMPRRIEMDPIVTGATIMIP